MENISTLLSRAERWLLSVNDFYHGNKGTFIVFVLCWTIPPFSLCGPVLSPFHDRKRAFSFRPSMTGKELSPFALPRFLTRAPEPVQKSGTFIGGVWHTGSGSAAFLGVAWILYEPSFMCLEHSFSSILD